MSRALDFTGLTIQSLIFDYLTDENSMTYLLDSITKTMQSSGKKRGTGNITKVLEPFKGLGFSELIVLLNDEPYATMLDDYEEKYGDDMDASNTISKNIIRVFKALTGQSILNQLKEAPSKELAEQLKTKNIKLKDNKHTFKDITNDLANADLTTTDLFNILNELYEADTVTVHTMFDTLQVKWGRIEMKTRNLTKSNVKEIVKKMKADGWKVIKEEKFNFKSSSGNDKTNVGVKGLWYRLIDLNTEKVDDIINELKNSISDNQNNIKLFSSLRLPLGRILLGDEDRTLEEISIEGQTLSDTKWEKKKFDGEKARFVHNYHGLMTEVNRSDVDLMYSIDGEKLTDPIFFLEKGAYEFNPVFFRIMYGNQSTVIDNGLDTEFGKYLSKLTSTTRGGKIQDVIPQDSLSRPKGSYSADEKKLLLGYYKKLKKTNKIPLFKRRPIFTDDDEDELKDRDVVSDATIEAIERLMENESFIEYLKEYNEDYATNFNYTNKDPLTQALIFAHENNKLDVVGEKTDQMREGTNLNNTLVAVLRVAYKFDDGLHNIGDGFAKTKPNTPEFEKMLKELEDGVVRAFSKLANDEAIIKGMNDRLDEILNANLPQSVYEQLQDKLIQEVEE